MTYNYIGLNRSLYTVMFLFSLLAASATLGSVAAGFETVATGHVITLHRL
jgi:hypothetical protein